MKIAVIGGGSTYTPELVSGLSRERDRIDVTELALHDIDAERRDVVGGMAGADARRARASTASSLVTGDLDRALDGADFVLVQIRVGGQAARLSDETIPLACGCIGQETTGAGGLAKALRTVPVVLEIADRVRERAAAGRVDHRLHEPGRHRHPRAARRRPSRDRPLQRRDRVPARVRVACSASRRQRVVVDQVGLNHLTWIRARPRRRRRRAAALLLAEHGDAARRATSALPRQLLDELGAIPSYYLRYFYAHDLVLAEQLDGSPAGGRRGRDRAAAARALPRSGGRREARRCSSSAAAPSTARRRPGLVASLVSGSGEVHEVDIRNDGTLAGLADDDVVEVPARDRRRRPRFPCPRRLSHRSCSGSPSTWRPTSGSRSRRR